MRASPGDSTVQPEVMHFTIMAEYTANLQPAFAYKLIEPRAGGIAAPPTTTPRRSRLRMHRAILARNCGNVALDLHRRQIFSSDRSAGNCPEAATRRRAR